ncbi:hypothetical protein [Bifidobacterium favimelis]|uniref:Phage protein n=1 Tax=Bifidobacterium favimelis TaxID=3122979 RepID=A0ABU8ZML8_9BIFI
MKFGIRTPGVRRSVSARSAGRWKRQEGKALSHGYGRKGMGWIGNPGKAACKKVYRKTTSSLRDLFE